ncbi:uncharacterized protein LOC143738158 [Siphateles boraxobius]|uniref:uncharacterized protein LOC143738158 n=1 Tax=Siphateles boraxobius TaxID=180520 RepID=UPI004063F2D5
MGESDQVLEYSFVTATINHGNEDHIDGYCSICIPGGNSSHGGETYEISVKKGEDLKLDVLFSKADKVERNSRSGWTEVWRRGHGVSSDRLTDHDGNLTINEFTANDTGTYRVLDSNNEALITVTVTESVLDSKGNLNDTDKDKTDDTEHRTVDHWILLVGLTVILMVLVVLAVGTEIT